MAQMSVDNTEEPVLELHADDLLENFHLVVSLPGRNEHGILLIDRWLKPFTCMHSHACMHAT